MGILWVNNNSSEVSGGGTRGSESMLCTYNRNVAIGKGTGFRIRLLQAELRSVLTKKRPDASEEDSPATSPAGRPQPAQSKGCSARWGGSCSDGSLLSIYSSGTGTDEEPFGPLSSHSSKLSLTRDAESNELHLESSTPLSHAAAKHRIAVRPRRTRRPRTRGTALPATLEEGSPASEAAPAPQQGADTVDLARRRSPSSSPQRTRNTLPAITGAEEHVPAVQRSRSSIADHRLRHLSPRKLFSRGGDSSGEKRSDGVGFFSRIFGSRRSGRKSKAGREPESLPCTVGSSEMPSAPAVQSRPTPAEQHRLPSSAGADRPADGHRTQGKPSDAGAAAGLARSESASSQSAELASAVGISRSISDNKPFARNVSAAEESLDRRRSSSQHLKACVQHPERRPSKSDVTSPPLSHRAESVPSVAADEHKTEPGQRPESESDDALCDRCDSSCSVTDTGSEGSPCILRRRQRTSITLDTYTSGREDAASDLQFRSTPSWVETELSRTPPGEGSHRRTWTNKQPRRVSSTSEVGLKPGSGPDHEATASLAVSSGDQRKLALNSGTGSEESVLSSDLSELSQSDAHNGAEKRKTYTVTDAGSVKAPHISGTEVQRTPESFDVVKHDSPPSLATERQISMPDSVVSPPRPPVKQSRRSLSGTYLGLPQSCAGSGSGPESVPVRPARTRPTPATKPSLAVSDRRSALSPADDGSGERATTARWSPEPPRRAGGGFGVVLRSVGRSDPPESGPQSLDSALSAQSDRPKSAARRRSSPGSDGNIRLSHCGAEASRGSAADAPAERSVSEDTGRSERQSSVVEQPGEKSNLPGGGSAGNLRILESDVTKVVSGTSFKDSNVGPSPVKSFTGQTESQATSADDPKSGPVKTTTDNIKEDYLDHESSGDSCDVDPVTKATHSSLSVPEFMKVQLQPVDAPLAMVSQVVVPKRPAPVLLGTPSVPAKNTEPVDVSRKPSQSGDAASGAPLVVGSSHKADDEPGVTSERSEPAPAPSPPTQTARKVSTATPVPPAGTKSPEPSRGGSSVKQSPVVLRKKAAASEESELAKVFKRRSLKMVGGEDASPKLQTAQPSQEDVQTAVATPVPQEKESEPPAAAPSWRSKTGGSGVTRESPACGSPPDSGNVKPWKAAPTVPSKPRPAVGVDAPPSSSAGSAQVPSSSAELRQPPPAENGATVAAETAAGTPRPASVQIPRQTPDNRAPDDDSASTADWLKQTVRERREQRELRELKHLRQPHPKELIIEPETLVPGRVAVPRSSRVLEMANTFQKLQPT